MNDRVKVKIHIDFEGATPETYGWPGLREFMDTLSQALKAMPENPDVDHIVPLRVEGGSVSPLVGMDRLTLAAFERLRSGPRPTWTAEMRRQAQPFYNHLNNRKASVAGGIRKLKPFKIPTAVVRTGVRELTLVHGVIERVGGNEGKIDVTINGDGRRLTCSAGRDLAAELGPYLYRAVHLSGEVERHPVTGVIEAMHIQGFHLADQGPPPLIAMARLRGMLETPVENAESAFRRMRR